MAAPTAGPDRPDDSMRDSVRICVTATVGLICTTAVSGLIIHNRYVRFGHLVPIRVSAAMRHPFSRK